MKKILFFSLLFIAGVLFVVSCGSDDPKEKCSCDTYYRGDNGLPEYSSTTIYEAAKNFWGTCASLQAHLDTYLKKEYPIQFDHMECKKVK